MKIAWLSPLPPVRSGIAGYSMMLLPQMAKLADVTAVVDQEDVDPAPPCRVIGIDEYRASRDTFDVAVAQVGNNLHHEFVWREASENRCVLVLHELVLHHLLTEMTLARGDADGFVRLLRENEGKAGESFARARSHGLHFEEGNFLFPASSHLASSSLGVIVHNDWARRRLVEEGVRVPISVVEHPLDELNVASDEAVRLRARKTFGFGENDRVIGMFGFVTMPKRPSIVFDAFAKAFRLDTSLRLLVVGESAPNIDLEALAREHDIPEDAWRATGWTTDRQFDEALQATDRVVGLRYPSAGESSGAIVRIFATGKPVAVSDYAQFSSFPDDVVTKIPLGQGEVTELVSFMTAAEDPDMAVAQKQWIADHGSPAKIAQAYLEAIREAIKSDVPAGSQPRPLLRSTLGLLPQVVVEKFRAEKRHGFVEIVADLTNVGDVEIRSSVWGVPAYRLIVKVAEGDRELMSAWWPLPVDLTPGSTVTVEGRLRGACADEVLFVHGWDGLPLTDEEPFFRAEVTD